MKGFDKKFGVEIEFSGIGIAQTLTALRNAGIQVHAERYNHTDHADHWKIVPDGSVANGQEVVSPILSGMDGLYEAARVVTALNKAGAKINQTCGLHVHFDAAELSVNELRTICERYAKHEAQIDAFMPTSRRANNNRYCMSLANVVACRAFKQARTVRELADAQVSRYFKVNLQAYLRHQTIEFRQHSGTVEATKLINWVLFLSAFIDESVRLAGANTSQASEAVAPLIALFADRPELSIHEMAAALGCTVPSCVGRILGARKSGFNIEKLRGSRYRLNGAAEAAVNDDLFDGIPEAVKMFYQIRALELAA